MDFLDESTILINEMLFFFFLQYEYFFENGEVPKVCEKLEPTPETEPKSQTNLLLDNVAKIECK